MHLSAVRQIQIETGHPDPLQVHMPKLKYILKEKKPWLALVVGCWLLLVSSANWNRCGEVTAEKWDTKILWATCCLCFFAFFRIEEVAVLSDSEFDNKVHLHVTMKDMAFNCLLSPSLFRLTIKHFKTDPFQKGVDLYVRRTSFDQCPQSVCTSKKGHWP